MTRKDALTTEFTVTNLDVSVKFLHLRIIFFHLVAGEVNTFYRGCEEKPDYLNDVIVDEQFKTYFRSCKTSLCNTGDGIKNIGGGGDGPNKDPGAEGSLVVPGIGAAAVASATFLLVILSALLGHLLVY